MRKGKIRIGTSGWSYPHWKGPFYPQDLADTGMLDAYSRHFDSVEVNTSFYHLPTQSTLIHWHDVTPKGFQFCAKGSRYLTHMKKLKNPEQSVATFFERMQTLGNKLGPILFQLPPRWRFNSERLGHFLNLLSMDFRYVFEFRDHSWLNDQCYEMLTRHNAALCIFELDGFQSPREITADLVYVRLHGPGGAYRGSYDDHALEAWGETLNRWSARGLGVYCYFDNDQAGYAAMNARKLQSIIPRP